MFILPEVAVQRALALGLKNIKDSPAVLDDIFCQYIQSNLLSGVYGQEYVDSIKNFVLDTKIPVLQAFSFDATRVPCVSVHLASENENESYAAMGDHFGEDDTSEIIVSVMTVNVDIGIHADKSKDHVLWLYYMVSYILYKEKKTLRSVGLQNITFSASDYNKESKYMAENIWTRWMRLKCTIQNYLPGEGLIEVAGLNTDVNNEPGTINP